MTDEKNCEAYFRKVTFTMDRHEEFTIQGVGRTPEEAFDTFMKIKKEVGLCR